ncbi:unnamed protein product [Closterium sp. Yama58-4]|nr:unnamed protein product [Closterium sp. Yama58-4]
MATPSGNILPLIADGTVKALWHDILLFPPPPSSSAASPTSPEAASYGDVIPTYTSSFSTTPPPPDNLCYFVCTRTRSAEAGGAGGGGAGKASNSAFRVRRRRLLLSGTTEFDEDENVPWNMGILPQTCVLACGAVADAANDGGSPGKASKPAPQSAIGPASAGNESGAAGSSDGFASLFDYAPIQAIEIGSAPREIGDAYGVIPLAALPVQRPNMGGSEVSYRMIVIAADDPLMIPEASGYNGFGVATIREGQIAEREELQEEVERWAVRSGFANRVDDWDLQEDKDADTVLVDAHRVWKLVFPTLRKPTRLARGATFRRLDPRTSFAARPGSPATAAPSRVMELVAKPAETCVISAAKSASFSHKSARKFNMREFNRAKTVGGGELYRNGSYGDSFGNDSFGRFDSPNSGGSDADLLSPGSGFGGGESGNGGRRAAGLPPASPSVRRVHSVEAFAEGDSSRGLSRSVTKSALVRSSTVLSKSKSSRTMKKSVSLKAELNGGEDGGRGGGSWFRRVSSKGGAVPRSESTNLGFRESDGCDDSGGGRWGRSGGASGSEGGKGLFTRSRTSAQLGGARVLSRGAGSGGSGNRESDLPPYAPFTRRHTHANDGRSSASEKSDEDLYFVDGDDNGAGLESADQKDILKARQPQRAAWMKKALTFIAPAKSKSRAFHSGSTAIENPTAAAVTKPFLSDSAFPASLDVSSANLDRPKISFAFPGWAVEISRAKESTVVVDSTSGGRRGEKNRRGEKRKRRNKPGQEGREGENRQDLEDEREREEADEREQREEREEKEERERVWMGVELGDRVPFLSLPQEILTMLCSRVSWRDLCTLRVTSKTVRNQLDRDEIWAAAAAEASRQGDIKLPRARKTFAGLGAVISGQAIGGQAISGQAISGQAISGQAISNGVGDGECTVEGGAGDAWWQQHLLLLQQQQQTQIPMQSLFKSLILSSRIREKLPVLSPAFDFLQSTLDRWWHDEMDSRADRIAWEVGNGWGGERKEDRCEDGYGEADGMRVEKKGSLGIAPAAVASTGAASNADSELRAPSKAQRDGGKLRAGPAARLQEERRGSGSALGESHSKLGAAVGLWLRLLQRWGVYRRWLKLVALHCPNLQFEVMIERARSNHHSATPTVYDKGVISFRSNVLLAFGLRRQIQEALLVLIDAAHAAFYTPTRAASAATAVATVPETANLVPLLKQIKHLFQELDVADDATLPTITHTQAKFRRCFCILLKKELPPGLLTKRQASGTLSLAAAGCGAAGGYGGGNYASGQKNSSLAGSAGSRSSRCRRYKLYLSKQRGLQKVARNFSH